MLVHFTAYMSGSPRVSSQYEIIRPAYLIRETSQPILKYFHSVGNTSTECVESL